MRYVAYLRVSTEQQADTGAGLAIQEQACRDWLRAGRHQLAGVCTDAGRSGSLSVADRHGLGEALAVLSAGKADGLLVYRLDRLARDMVMQEQLLAELHRRELVLASCSATENEHLTDDADDPTRALVRRILGSVAAYERDMIRLRLRTGRARKRIAGGYVAGAPPYGYAAVGRELVPVEPEQEVIRLIRRLVREGWSLAAVCAELERRGIASRAQHRRWRKSTVAAIADRAGATRRRALAVTA